MKLDSGRPFLDPLWAAALGPPVAWGLHLLLAYYIATFSTSFGVGWQRVALAVLTGVALALIALCALPALPTRVRRREEQAPEPGAERMEFMSRVALMSVPLFALATLLTALPAFVLRDF